MSKKIFTLLLIVSVLFNVYFLTKKPLIKKEVAIQTVVKVVEREPAAIRERHATSSTVTVSAPAEVKVSDSNEDGSILKTKILLEDGNTCTKEMLTPKDPTKDEVIKKCNEKRIGCTVYKESFMDKKSALRIIRKLNNKSNQKTTSLQIVANKILNDAYEKMDEMRSYGLSESEQNIILKKAEAQVDVIYKQMEKIKYYQLWNEDNYCSKYDHCVVLE